MLLTITAADVTVPATTFTIRVPGDQRWTLRSVLAVASRDVGGLPNRSYSLAIVTPLGTVALIGAADLGAEPGVETITWTQAQAAAVASGATSVAVAPLPPFVLEPGYRLVGTIVNPVGVDQWASALAWYDFAYTA